MVSLETVESARRFVDGRGVRCLGELREAIGIGNPNGRGWGHHRGAPVRSIVAPSAISGCAGWWQCALGLTTTGLGDAAPQGSIPISSITGTPVGVTLLKITTSTAGGAGVGTFNWAPDAVNFVNGVVMGGASTNVLGSTGLTVNWSGSLGGAGAFRQWRPFGVSTWADQSGNGRDLTATTTKPGLQLVAADQRLTWSPIAFDSFQKLANAGLATSIPYTVAFVLKQRFTAANVWMTGAASISRTNVSSFATAHPGTALLMNSGSSLIMADQSIDSITNWHSYVITFNASASAAYVNKTLVKSGNAGASSASGLALGGQFDGTAMSNLDVLDLAVFSKTLGGFERQALSNYYNAAYGVP